MQEHHEISYRTGYTKVIKLGINYGYRPPRYSRTVDLSTLPASVNWTAMGGVTGVKDQVIHFVLYKTIIL